MTRDEIIDMVKAVDDATAGASEDELLSVLNIVKELRVKPLKMFELMQRRNGRFTAPPPNFVPPNPEVPEK